MTHYVVLLDWSSQDDCGASVIGVRHTFEEAKKLFRDTVKKEKEIIKNNGWEIYDDTNTCFDAGEDGYYAVNHSTIRIQEVM